MQGFDKAGRPIVVLLGARHFKAEIEEFKRKLVLGNMDVLH
jgi:hypothetical protein